MIYPNFIYHPDSDLELFIDTVQQTKYVTGCTSHEYARSSGGRGSVVTPQLATATFECTWIGNHADIFRYTEYLKGKDVIICFGPLDLASYAKIINVSFPWTIGNAQKATLSVQFLGAVRGQFREAEDSRNTATGTTILTDSTASGNAALVTLDLDGGVYISLTQSEILLPEGDYTVFARVRSGGANLTDDVELYVKNETDSNDLVSDSFTLSGSSYQVITADFTVDSGDSGDVIKVGALKNSSTGGLPPSAIYFDFLGFVARS